MLNAEVRYLEHMVGPPRNINRIKTLIHTYIVEGCTVTAHVSGSTITALGLELSPKCTFDLNVFFPVAGKPQFPLAHRATINKFDGDFRADCLGMCGNAYDPSVYKIGHTSRAWGDLDVRVNVLLTSKAAIDAAVAWEAAMKKAESEDWMLALKFNCTDKYNSPASEAFRNVRITSIVIGYGLQEKLPECEPQ